MTLVIRQQPTDTECAIKIAKTTSTRYKVNELKQPNSSP